MSTTLNELSALQLALVLHQQGRLDEAEHAYRAILLKVPSSFNALAFLGTLQLQRGLFEAAVPLFERSIAIQSRQPVTIANLGAALLQLGRLPDALKCLDRALTLQPDLVDAIFNRALVLLALKREAEALQGLQQTCALQPMHLDARLKAAEVLHDMSRHDDAIATCEELLALAPTMPAAHVVQGNVFFAIGRFADAVTSYERAFVLDAGNAEVIYNKGIALARQGDYSGALCSFNRALELRPDFAVAALERAAALRKLGRVRESLAAHDELLARHPDFLAAHCNQAAVLQDHNRIDEALACIDTALRLAPDNADLQWNKAVLLLTQGEYVEGWQLYESRWRRPEKRGALTRFKKPQWSGQEPLAGKAIVLHPEQGLGDVIQFVRYAPMFAERGARVILEVQPSLCSLMSSVAGVVQVIAHGEPLPTHDYHCPLMSLPAAFDTNLGTIPAAMPYLHADPVRCELWKERLGAKKAMRVGLAWSGNATQANDHNRSMLLADIWPLTELPVELHVVQKEVRAVDEAFLSAHPEIRRWDAMLADFADTAALITEMDLVIAVCTSVAHLGGALGKPLWMPLCFAADYRWLLAREDSPWYPSARLFRQTAPGDWAGVMQRIAAALRRQ